MNTNMNLNLNMLNIQRPVANNSNENVLRQEELALGDSLISGIPRLRTMLLLLQSVASVAK
jgi:hypothetical protein